MALIPVMPTTKLKHGLEICKITNGMWQLSGAHGDIDVSKAVIAMTNYAEMGFTTFDMADIYGPAEDIFGHFMQMRDNSLNSIQALTKFVPRVGEMSRKIVETHINRSIAKMGVPKLDCLQLHWWDYEDKRYMDALKHLSDMRSEGKIGELSLTNFDTKHLEEILKSGVSISTNQVQYSIIDQRPKQLMKTICDRYSVKLLAYGTLCGGLLSEKYLGTREPTPHELNTPSLGKYKQVIDQWGGWNLFQEMLGVLDKIAKEHNVSIANVASRYILNDATVGAVLIGCRFGIDGCDHAEDNFRSISSTWSLSAENLASIKAVQDKSNNLFEIIGDCGAEYR